MIEKLKNYWQKEMGSNPALKIAGLICIALFVFVLAPILVAQSGLLASRQTASPQSEVPATDTDEETTTIDVVIEQETPVESSDVVDTPVVPASVPPSAAPAVIPVAAPPMGQPPTELTAQERAALERERAAAQDRSANERPSNERPGGFNERPGGETSGATGGFNQGGDRRDRRNEMPTGPGGSAAPSEVAGPNTPTVAPPAIAPEATSPAPGGETAVTVQPTTPPVGPATPPQPNETVTPPSTGAGAPTNATAGPSGPRDQRDSRDQRTSPNTVGTTQPSGANVALTTPSNATASIPPGEKKISFKFTNTRWRDVISWLATESGFSLDMQSAPQGTFNYTDSRTFTPDEAIDLLNKYLLLREFSLVRVEKMLILLGPGQGVPPEFMHPITPEELDAKGEFELTCVLFQPKRTTTEDIQNEIESMIRPPGSIVINPKSQTMRITERGGQLRAIRDIIQRLDDTGIGNFTAVKLDNLPVDEAVGIVRQLLSIKEDDTSLRIVPDVSGEKLLLSGRKDLVEQAKEAFELVDNEFTKEIDDSEVRFGVYTIDTADPEVVFKVIQTRLVGLSKVRLSLDSYTSSIVLQGPENAHDIVRSIISEMQVNAMRIETIRLRRLSVAQAQSAVEKFFIANATTQRATTTTTTQQNAFQGNRGTNQNQNQNRNQPAASTSANAMVPTVGADSVNRQLIVKATSSQIAMIKKLLEEMGEPSFDNRDNSSMYGNTSGAMIRKIAVPPAAQEIVLQQLQQSWGMMNNTNRLYINDSSTATRNAPIPVWDSREQANQGNPASRGNDQTRPGNTSAPNSGSPDAGNTDGRSNEEIIREMLERRANSVRTVDSETAETDNTVDSVFRPVVYSRQSDGEEELVPVNLGPARRPGGEARGPRFEQPEGRGDQGMQGRQQMMQYGQPNAPVNVTIGADGSLILISEDPAALDQVEDLLRTLSDPTILKETKKLIQYRLHYVKADAINSTLQTLMGSSSYSSSVTSTQNDENSLLDSGPMGAILDYLNEGANVRATGPITMTPLTSGNHNSLWIEANIVDHQTIQRLLMVLDQPNSSDDPAILPKPRLIQFNNIRAETALERINEVFADNIGSSQQNTGNTRGQQNQMMNPQMMMGGPQQMMQMMMGGRNMNQTTQSNVLKMTLSLDTTSNSVIVNAPEELFNRVADFAKELDAAAISIAEITEVIKVVNINPAVYQSALSSASDSIVVSTGTSSSTQSNQNRNTANQFGGTTFGGNTQNRGGTTAFGGNTQNRGRTTIGGGTTMNRGTTGGMGAARGGTTIGGGTARGGR